MKKYICPQKNEILKVKEYKKYAQIKKQCITLHKVMLWDGL